MNLTDYHAKYYAYELTRRCPSDRVERIASTLMDAQVDLNPHQVDAALFDFRSPLSIGAFEQDGLVIKWLRPARNHFHIYYDRNTKRHEPDFVAETATAIYMVETKKAGDLDTDAVQKKKTAALNYCAAASAYTAATGGKPWVYLLIPHDAVMLNMTLEGLAAKYCTKV